MTVADCGGCRTHGDCTTGFATTCFHRNGPGNFCAGECTKDQKKDEAVCLYDEDAGTEIWKCKHGFEGVSCEIKMDCSERCLNGAKPCNQDGSCNCHDHFTGDYCEKPSECHPG